MQIGEITSKAAAALNDVDGVRWSPSELIDYLNSALYALSALQAVSFEATRTITLIAGAKQSIPANTTQLLTVVRNINADNTTGPAILPMSKTALDLHSPAWWLESQSATIENFAYDPEKNVDVFYVYPPAVAGTKVEASVAEAVVPVSDPTEPLPVDDIYEPVILDYVLARAFMKNSEVAEIQKAKSYFESFYTGLGLSTKAAQSKAAQAVEAA